MKIRPFQKILVCLIAIVCWFVVSDVNGQEPVSLQSTVTHLLYSEQLQQHYLIDVFLPKGYEAKENEFQFPKYPGTFSRFGTNVIVGRLGKTTGQKTANGNVITNQPGLGVAVYNRTGNQTAVLSKSATQRIVNHLKN